MLTTKVTINEKIYNIQTEDKGHGIAEIETLVYSGGQVMAAWRISYAKLIEKGADEEMIFRLMQLQHKEIIDQIKRGVLSFEKTDIQIRAKPEELEHTMDEMVIDYMMKNLEVEELKLKVEAAMELKKGNQVIIKVSARKHISAAPIEGAHISFNIVEDADANPQEVFKGKTNSLGQLEASFFIPNFSGNGALIIEADSIWGKDRVIQNIIDGT
jgi:glucan biosynthesis protein